MQYEWLNKQSREMLERGYLPKGQTPEERIDQICQNAQDILSSTPSIDPSINPKEHYKDYAKKLKSYVAKGWVSFSSPVWSNFGTDRGLPISCYGSHMEDTTESILYKNAEIGMMTKQGGGTACYIGDLRGRGSDISGGGTSNGAVHFARKLDTTIDVMSQSSFRRGNAAVYYPMDGDDIDEFLSIRSEGNPIQNLHSGVSIKNSFFDEMFDGNKDNIKRWSKLLKQRYETGEPYIFFHDNVNNGVSTPEWYKNKLYTSQLCTEILLPTSSTSSFVCCLSSVNLLFFEDWKDTDLVNTMIEFLDSVITEFVIKASSISFMEHAVAFAKEHRALGLGVLGYHSLLQSKQIPFESFQAQLYNKQIFTLLEKESVKATQFLSSIFGSAPYLKQYNVNRRNAALLAPAPTKSSSELLGQVSPSFEVQFSNYYNKQLAKGNYTYKNPYLQNLLETKDANTPQIWNSILQNDGSVQHLTDILNEEERNTFKTFAEVNQREIIQQAATRQDHIDQGQSINLKIPSNVPMKETSKLMIDAWKQGIKTLYYQHSTSPVQDAARLLSQQCSACEG